MKIRMITHYARAADGVTVRYYNGGEKYDLPDDEARLFIKVGVAVEDKEATPVETKGAGPQVAMWAHAPEHNASKKRRK